MNTKVVDGELYAKLICGGYKSLKSCVNEINDLNVFPIPDGDTGDNMCHTMSGGASRIINAEVSSLEAASSEAAKGMLLGARGNSGVILSQFFAGIAKGLEGKGTADVKEFGDAVTRGVEFAYNSVAVPVEGTMLTVIKDASVYANANITEDSTIDSFCEDFCEEAAASLKRTPELLSVLKEAGVIDSGGAGICEILNGFIKVLRGEEITDADFTENTAANLDYSKFNENSEMKYGYCTEFLLQLQKSKTDTENFSVDDLIEFFKSVGGDSVVAFKTGTVVKVHVHTLTPGKILNHCQQFGEFLTVKVENMTLQHNEVIGKKEVIKPVKKKKYAVVAVANGEGLIKTFRDLGADEIIDGGQGHNPSTEDFINSFDKVNAENVFVLPNNSNIIMAAEQAANIYDKSKVYVIGTKNIGDGYSAMASADYLSDDPETIKDLLEEGLASSVTGMVTRAVRNACINGVKIKEGAYIGFKNKVMLCSDDDKTKTALSVLDKLGGKDKDFLVVFFGKNVTEAEKADFEERLEESFPDLEYYGVDGGQDSYDYITVLR